MRILHVSTYDEYGGAARAVSRLHRALLGAGIESRMLVARKDGDGPETEQLPGRGRALRDELRRRCDAFPLRRYVERENEPFSVNRICNGTLLRRIAEIAPDVVHLHWVSHGFLSIEDLAKIGKPIVWTLHDSWMFTGGCHCPQECLRYRGKCGDCPILKSDADCDLSRAVFRRKAKVYPRLERLRIVTPSEWLAQSARESALLKGREVTAIPNALDVDRFHPMDRVAARSLLNLPGNRKLVLFGAMNALQDRNKGFDLLCGALARLDCKEGVELVLFGAPAGAEIPELPVPARNVGFVRDDATLCALYNACDAMVVPSRQESQSQTATESLACGTPVVAFRASGVQEMVLHGEDGYLAEPFDVVDLARGIDAMLRADSPPRLREKAREEAVRRFAFDAVAARYERIYRDILDEE